MATRPHEKLAKCHVLFLGNSVPVETKRGLEAVQQPLFKCYPVEHPNEVEGIDSWLTVFTSGVLLQLIGGGKDEQPAPIWFPIQNLFVAAAVKCVSYVDGKGNRYKTEFADINDTQAKLSSHPPIFSMIVRKSTGKRTLQCYSFLVRDERPAVTMVDAAKYAFLNQSGWSNSHPPEDVSMYLYFGISLPSQAVLSTYHGLFQYWFLIGVSITDVPAIDFYCIIIMFISGHHERTHADAARCR